MASKEWVAEWISTKPLTRRWMVAGEVHHFQNPALLFITDGQSAWDINGQKVQISCGQLIAVETGTVIKLTEGGTPDLSGWELQFNLYTLFSGEERKEVDWKVPAGNSFQQVQLSGLTLAGLGHYFREENAQDLIQIRISNQSLLYELLKHIYRKQPRVVQTIEEGLQRSVSFMHEYYGEVITRNQLAQITGVSPWHYSRKFSERYGVSPLSYLSQYRVFRAQEQLLLTEYTSQEISRQAGFEDAHYFSRRFKQLTGVSPRNYVQSLGQRKIMVLSPLIAETMIMLDIIPHSVAVSPILLADHQHKLFASHHIEIIETAQFDLDVERIAVVQPELIIGPYISEEKKQKLRNVAPVIGDLQLDLEELLLSLGALLEKDAEVRSILMHLENKRAEARNQLESIIRSGATVMVLRIEPFGYRYLGGRSTKLSRLLYGQLQLTLPEPLKSGEGWFNPCSVELLELANPDYLFVEPRVMEHFDAGERWRELMESRQWGRLKAVQNNKVFSVDTRLWVDGFGGAGFPLILNQITSCISDHEEYCAQ
ncbi:helix-turn-helix domain-containing protein [Paenibacillus sp. FSL R7-0331]|uniref:helix-turn-helix domain-containing protein n=1 Tax=Paenibacillus sp. FSL R7-0331 TaxID=1536773 RepID=UPI001E57D6E3|nr:helix-turn-helix domain-containing protein [Paenibacillus sp. FSL R7-0331]